MVCDRIQHGQWAKKSPSQGALWVHSWIGDTLDFPITDCGSLLLCDQESRLILFKPCKQLNVQKLGK